MTLNEMFELESREGDALKAMGFMRLGTLGGDLSVAVIFEQSTLRTPGGRCFVEVAERLAHGEPCVYDTPGSYWEPLHRLEPMRHAQVTSAILERAFTEAVAVQHEMHD